jgi:hypothetical protein
MAAERTVDLSHTIIRIPGVRLFALVVPALVWTSVAVGRSGQTVRAHGVALTVPATWQRVASAGDGPVTDPRTLLVVGTAGVTPKASQCQIAGYRVPTHGAVVVIVGWRTATSGGGQMKPGRWPLKTMNSVRRPSFECFAGRGAAASLVLGGKAYQVNVMVGALTSPEQIVEALAVGRSFRLAP